MSKASAYQKLWYAEGLTFACTQCGRCCYGASQRQVRLNETEQQAAADHLKIGSLDFVDKYMLGTERLRWNDDGSCILLKQGKCSIHPVRPTQCATYPFWSSHLASEVDWRATAATCEGITPHKMQKAPERSTREPSDASSKRTALQLIDEFRTGHQAGHGVEPPGKITPAQVVKALIMNELHASGDMPEAAQECEELLSVALEEGELRDTIQDVADAQRRVVHDDGHLLVLDSRIGEHWQRDVVLASCPSHTQSCVYLSQGPEDARSPVHSELPSSTPVFQMLAACVPGLQLLRDEKHPACIERMRAAAKLENPKHERKSASALSDDSPLHCARPMAIAVVGAGACSVPAYLAQNLDDVLIHAVDIDDRVAPILVPTLATLEALCMRGMFQIAKTYMGVKESQALTLMHADGLDFIRPDFKTSAPAAQSYDVIILDVAVPAQEGAPGPLVLSPAPLFLGDRFLGDAVWRRLRPDGMLVINALGPEKHLTAVEEALTRHAHVFRWHLKDAATTVFLALPTKAPCPESVQLEGWDGVWGDGTVAYWDPKLVDEADITRSIFAHSHQECSAVRDVEVWKAQNCRPSSF